MFHIAKHRRQIILAVEFDKAGAAVYQQLKGNTDEELVVKTSDKIKLDEITSGMITSFKGNLTTKTKSVTFFHSAPCCSFFLVFFIYPPFPEANSQSTISSGVIKHRIKIYITHILKNRALDGACHDASYPSAFMPFYLYGTPKEAHIDHVLVRSPNIVLSAESITLTLDDGKESDDAAVEAIGKGAILALDGVHEASMQPFSSSVQDIKKKKRDGFFFQPGARFRVRIWEDARGAWESGKGLVDEVSKAVVLATGEVVLGEELLVDVEKVNRDPFAIKEDERVGRWRERFEEIGKGLGEVCIC
jgi:hypothetical protein